MLCDNRSPTEPFLEDTVRVVGLLADNGYFVSPRNEAIHERPDPDLAGTGLGRVVLGYNEYVHGYECRKTFLSVGLLYKLVKASFSGFNCR